MKAAASVVSSFAVAALSACALVTMGCSTMPQPAPLLGQRGKLVALSGAWGTQYSPVRANLGPKFGELRSKYDGLEGSPAGLIFDPRVGAALTPNEHVQLAVHAGWLVAGGAARWIPNGMDSAVPLALSLGGQFNSVASHNNTGGAWDVSLLASVHPRLASWLHASLGGGVSQGRRRYSIVLPDNASFYGVDEQFDHHLRVLRSETRLEALAGVWGSIKFIQVSLAVQPFWALNQGTPKAYCSECLPGWQLDSFEANWGMAVTLTCALSPR